MSKPTQSALVAAYVAAVTLEISVSADKTATKGERDAAWNLRVIAYDRAHSGGVKQEQLDAAYTVAWNAHNNLRCALASSVEALTAALVSPAQRLGATS